MLGGELVVARRAYPVLRETRMAAVVCELVADGDVDAVAAVVAPVAATSPARWSHGIRHALGAAPRRAVRPSCCSQQSLL